MRIIKYIPVLLLALGCAPYLSEDSGRCPCKDGWKCCNGQCIPEQDICDPDGDGGFDADGNDGDAVIIATRESGYHSAGGTIFSKQGCIYLGIDTSYPECYGGIGNETPHSGPETTVYTATNEDAFNDLVACMTNGVDDSVVEGFLFYPNGSGSGGTYHESEFWNLSPDLAGCTVTEIRNVITSLTFTPEGEGGIVDGEWVWEVWGDCGGGD